MAASKFVGFDYTAHANLAFSGSKPPPYVRAPGGWALVPVKSIRALRRPLVTHKAFNVPFHSKKTLRPVVPCSTLQARRCLRIALLRPVLRMQSLIFQQ
jgi:hypothetical protein